MKSIFPTASFWGLSLVLLMLSPARADLISTGLGTLGNDTICMEVLTHSPKPPFQLFANPDCDDASPVQNWTTDFADDSAAVEIDIGGTTYCLNTFLKNPTDTTGIVNVDTCDGSDAQRWTYNANLSIHSTIGGREYHIWIDPRTDSKGVFRAWTAGNHQWQTTLRFAEPVLNTLPGTIKTNGDVVYEVKGFPSGTVQVIQPATGGFMLVDDPMPTGDDVSDILKLAGQDYYGQIEETGSIFFWTHDRVGFYLNRNGNLTFRSPNGKTQSVAADGTIPERHGRDVRFLATADPQYNNNPSNTPERQAKHDKTNEAMAEINNRLDDFRGLIVAGDLTTLARSDEFEFYTTARGTRNAQKYYETIGNHDMYVGNCCNGTEIGGGCKCAGKVINDSLRSSARNLKSVGELYCSKGYQEDRCDTPPQPYYSWKWDDVLFVSLGLFGGNADTWIRDDGERGDQLFSGWNSLEFLKQELESHNGPVILSQHYCFNPDVGLCKWDGTSAWWTDAMKEELWATIAGHDVLGIVVGHWHSPATWFYEWLRPAGRTDGPDSIPTFTAGQPADGRYVEFDINDRTFTATLKNTFTTSEDCYIHHMSQGIEHMTQGCP